MRCSRWLVFSFIMVAAVLGTRAAEVAAMSDLDAAKARAASEGRQIVVEFSGRTWCPPCKALLSEVIGSEVFAAFAAERIMVHLDYPRRSERTPEKIAADTELARLMALRDAYKIEGFPTVVLLDPQGQEIGRVLGYEPGAGPEAFLTELTGRK